MRLAFFIPSLHRTGGMERVLTTKANYLANAGYEVHLVTWRQKGRKPAFSLDPRVRLADLGDRSRFRGSFPQRLRQAIAALKPDISLSLGGRDAFFLPAAAEGRPCVAEYHFCYDKFFLKYSRAALKPYAWLRTWLRDRAFSKFDGLVSLTKEDCPAWAAVCRRVWQIYNPLTLSGGLEAPSGQPRGKRVIAAGRLVKEKNFADLIRAWESVAALHPDWRLDIFGEGRERKRLQTLIFRLGLEGRAALRGSSDSLACEYAKSSLLALSSKREGFPLVLIEGSSLGLPLISYACPTGPSEIIEDGVNGLLVKPGDRQQLAKALCRLIEDKELRGRMGAEALRSSERFSLPRIMKQWESLFAELAGS